MRRVLQSAAKHIIPRVVAAYPEEKLPPKDAVTKAMTATDLDLVEAASDYEGWTDLVEEFTAELASVGVAAQGNFFTQLHISDEGILDRANARVLEYARTRGAELVGKRRLADGTLIDNPRPEWAISETTRANIRADVNLAFEEGLSRRDLQTLLENMYDFSDYRARMVAQTELSIANNEAQTAAWRESGVVAGKVWHMSSSSEVCDICIDNAEAGLIGIDEDFPSGDSIAPAHPNCRCFIEPIVDEDTLETLAPAVSSGPDEYGTEPAAPDGE